MRYDVHELAALVPLANEAEQLALTEDIKVNGQQEPIVLWNDKIVDGRCRQIACGALGVVPSVRRLADDSSLDEVKMVVKSLNTRRNLTETQKVMSALGEVNKGNATQAQAATSWAISVRTLQNAAYINRECPEYFQPLFNGNSVVIHDKSKGINYTTNKITTLARLIKANKEINVVEDVSERIEWSADSAIKTESGKEWYYSRVNAKPHLDIETRMDLVELANYKFKL